MNSSKCARTGFPNGLCMELLEIPVSSKAMIMVSNDF